MNIQKCVVIGCGGVGATTAFTLIQGGLFNEIVLIDINQDRAEGEALDIGHGVPFTRPVKVYAGNYSDVKDAYLVIITAGANQAPGETRLDIAAKNAGIFRQIIPQIVQYNQECILLVVTNPVDILTGLTLKLSGFPACRVLGSGTVLDTARLKYLLASQLVVDSRNIHAFVIGEHGDSEVVVWSGAKVSGLSIDEYCSNCGSCKDEAVLEEIEEDVRDSAYEIIEKKGATFYAIAMAVKRIATALVRDEHSVLPVSNLASGHYGLGDVCLGIPAAVGRGGVEHIVEIPLSPEEDELLHRSAAVVKETLMQILQPHDS